MMMSLSSYAALDAHSKGRCFPEIASPHRNEFQRDRDRIIHCSAFRRLEYKTQVFVNHEGDLFRTRLTHTLEVAQIGRTIARFLGLNEDLVEAIALAHDLGHTPFGHAGQRALNACMQGHGGFEHNLQSLRVVDTLEARYAAFDGLNLSFETREGILKRCPIALAAQLGDLGQRFLVGGQPSLEAQVANLADEIAYNNHDVDDGLRSQVLTLASLREVPLLARYLDEVVSIYPDLSGRRLIYETVRRLINVQVSDVLQETQARLGQVRPVDIDDVRRQSEPLVAFSVHMRAELDLLKKFLFKNLYRHYLVNREMFKAQRMIHALFDAFMGEPRLLPTEHQSYADQNRPRAVADYIAGMTDRFALEEYRRLFVIA